MKRKITKEDFEKLSDALKANYSEKGGSYFLNIEDDDEAITELKKARENEKESHRESKLKMKDLETKIEELTNGKHKIDGNIEALENSWKEKFNTRETELTLQISKLNTIVIQSAKDSITSSLANEISNSPKLMKRILDERVSVEITETGPVHRILDAQGKPSAMTLEDLKKETIANKEYSPIIIASRASGAAGSGFKVPNGSGAAPANDGKPVILANLNPKDMAAHIAATKTEN